MKKTQRETVPEAIRRQCHEIGEFLVEKNQAYGNSAFEPMGIFSDLTADQQVRVRIDDKLSRLARGQQYSQEDTILDLVGYLVILRVIQERDHEAKAHL